MITMLPRPGAFGATVVMGQTAAGLRAAVVLKAVYDLVADGTGPRRAALREGPAPAIRMADALAEWIGGEGEIMGPVEEADIALEKAWADIVVERFRNAGTGGTVTIDGAPWLERAADAAGVGDAPRHLFGRQSRAEPPRRLVPAAADPATGLPGGYSAAYNNVFRRTPGFQRRHALAALPPGGVVAIGNGAATYRFALPRDRFAARVRWWSGHCPDRPGRWALRRLALAADTLVVAPAEHRATLLWRASWPWAAYPADSYRAVEIVREED